MTTYYKVVPSNFYQIDSLVETDKKVIPLLLINSMKCYFYDACSFRRHANLEPALAEYILQYIKRNDGSVIITRTILMELASQSGTLNPEYIDYIKAINQHGINVIVVYEENLFEVLELCFSVNSEINEILTWAVRMVKNPISTITETLEAEPVLKKDLLGGFSQNSSDLYSRFFQAVRNNKEQGDNLGEELLAVCFYLLTHLPGEPDAKYCVITDDKGAAGGINDALTKMPDAYRGSKICIFSTPKLVQVMNREQILTDENDIAAILRNSAPGNVVVYGTRLTDINVDKISLTCEDLAKIIMEPNGINIIF